MDWSVQVKINTRLVAVQAVVFTSLWVLEIQDEKQQKKNQWWNHSTVAPLPSPPTVRRTVQGTDWEPAGRSSDITAVQFLNLSTSPRPDSLSQRQRQRQEVQNLTKIHLWWRRSTLKWSDWPQVWVWSVRKLKCVTLLKLSLTHTHSWCNSPTVCVFLFSSPFSTCKYRWVILREKKDSSGDRDHFNPPPQHTHTHTLLLSTQQTCEWENMNGFPLFDL